MCSYKKLLNILEKENIDLDEFLRYLEIDDHAIKKIKSDEIVETIYLKMISDYLDVKLYEIIEFV